MVMVKCLNFNAFEFSRKTFVFASTFFALSYKTCVCLQNSPKKFFIHLQNFHYGMEGKTIIQCFCGQQQRFSGKRNSFARERKSFAGERKGIELLFFI